MNWVGFIGYFLIIGGVWFAYQIFRSGTRKSKAIIAAVIGVVIAVVVIDNKVRKADSEKLSEFWLAQRFLSEGNERLKITQDTLNINKHQYVAVHIDHNRKVNLRRTLRNLYLDKNSLNKAQVLIIIHEYPFSSQSYRYVRNGVPGGTSTKSQYKADVYFFNATNGDLLAVEKDLLGPPPPENGYMYDGRVKRRDISRTIRKFINPR